MSRVLREEEALKFQNEMRQLKDTAVEQGALHASLTEKLATLERAQASCYDAGVAHVLLMCC